MTQVILQFSKLEKIVIGGTKGKALTSTVEHIYGTPCELIVSL